jgi:hypothetical protein
MRLSRPRLCLYCRPTKRVAVSCVWNIALYFVSLYVVTANARAGLRIARARRTAVHRMIERQDGESVVYCDWRHLLLFRKADESQLVQVPQPLHDFRLTHFAFCFEYEVLQHLLHTLLGRCAALEQL